VKHGSAAPPATVILQEGPKISRARAADHSDIAISEAPRLTRAASLAA